MSRDLALMAGTSYVFLVVLWCFVRYVAYWEPREKAETWRKHGTPYRGKIRRKGEK